MFKKALTSFLPTVCVSDIQICDCQNGARCNKRSGRCKCAPGYTGDKCKDSESEILSVFIFVSHNDGKH